MRDMISTTPMAEYIDLLYIRLAIAVNQRRGSYPPIERWWLELHPPFSDADGVGCVRIRALVPPRNITYEANIHAVQHGAVMQLGELTIATDYHVRQFLEGVSNER